MSGHYFYRSELCYCGYSQRTCQYWTCYDYI